VLTVAVCFVALASGLRGRVQEVEARTNAPQATSGPKPLYFGVTACAGCHTRGKPWDDCLCSCTEFPIWDNKDKHRNAYLVLKKDRAQHMGKLLDKDVLDPEAGCVSCHGVRAPTNQRHPSFRIEEGVSCIACHGAYEDWVDEHGSFLKHDKWRAQKTKDKEERYGMKDLWSPGKRTSLCVSCHIGNVDERKFVTHEMYAAGHPPLPGIEIATFCNQMPRHWEFLKVKSPKVREVLGFDRDYINLEQTRLVVVSSVAELSETMKLVAAQADKCANATDTGAKSLDFANFDCYACHHDLKSPSQRVYVGKPGRPQMAPWPTRLAKVSLEVVLKNDQASKALDEGMKKLYDAFSIQPFGNCQQIAAAAKALTVQLDQWSAELSNDKADAAKVKYDHATGMALLHKLTSLTEKDVADYDTARQIAWAIDVIYSELTPESKDWNPKIKELIDSLKLDLKLTLPERPDGSQSEVIVDSLPEYLAKRNSYDAKAFRESLKKLSALLSAKT
jgi:hypothetical protein